MKKLPRSKNRHRQLRGIPLTIRSYVVDTEIAEY